MSDGQTRSSRAPRGPAPRSARAARSPPPAIIAEVVRQALAGAGRLAGDVLLVGAAGAGREPEREELRKALRGENLAGTSRRSSTDIEIALAAAFDEGPGIVVSAGTGSVAVGRDRAGQRHRIGGYGWQMGDEGSGYAIGRAALGAVSRAATAGVHAPRSATGAGRDAELRASTRWCAGPRAPRRRRWPRWRPHVLDVAAQGDTARAGASADYAARELSQLAICLLPDMDLQPPGGGRAHGWPALELTGRSAGACWRGFARTPRSPRSRGPGGRGRRVRFGWRGEQGDGAIGRKDGRTEGRKDGRTEGRKDGRRANE